MPGLLFSLQLHETGDVSTWSCRSLQFNRKSWKSECFRDAKRDNSFIFIGPPGKYALHDGKELLFKPFLGTVDELGDSKVLPTRFNPTENNPDSRYVSS